METELLYLEDAYLKECDGIVKWFEFTDLIVDRTVFYPTGGGQPNDKGHVVIDGRTYPINDVWSDGNEVHIMSLDTYSEDIKGKPVHQVLDWDVRYQHMKFRTALKVITSMAFKLYGATNRINQTYEDQAWVDIEVDEINEEMVKTLEEETNKILKGGIDTETFYLSKGEFERDGDLMKISKGEVPDSEKIRILKIGDLPLQHDIGINVKNTSEVGAVKFKTTLIKGKISKRITVLLE